MAFQIAMWARMDSNHRTPKRTDLQSVVVGHLTTCPTGAREGTRTPDQLITNQLLYQLSYSGNVPGNKLNSKYLKILPVPRLLQHFFWEGKGKRICDMPKFFKIK